jgi:hypothetical protein
MTLKGWVTSRGILRESGRLVSQASCQDPSEDTTIRSDIRYWSEG